MPPPFVSPAQGGPAWAQLTTPHFTLYTDSEASEAQAIALALEEIHGVLEAVSLPYPAKPPGRFEVTVFRNVEPLRQIAPTSLLRLYLGRESHDFDRTPMMVLSATSLSFQRDANSSVSNLLRHFLTHRLIALDLPTAPAWLNEGLASFNETIQQTDGSHVQIGREPDSMLLGYESSPESDQFRGMVRIPHGPPGASRDRTTAATIVALDSKFWYRHAPGPAALKAKNQFRGASWNLVRTMLLGPPPLRAAFAQYLDALNKGNEPRAAWAASLRDNGVSPEQLEVEYDKTFERWPNEFETRAIVPRPPAALQTRPMTEAEVHLLWARVRPWQGENLQRAGADLNAALVADPNFVPAYSLRGEWQAVQGRHAAALADLRKAIALAPDNFLPAYALARYLDFYQRKNPAAKDEFEGELRTLVEGLRRSAGSARVWDFLASDDARLGELERALAFAQKATVADPTCFECYQTTALLLYHLGRVDEAVAMQRISVGRTPEGLAEPAMVKRLQAFERELAARTTSRATPP